MAPFYSHPISVDLQFLEKSILQVPEIFYKKS